MTVTTAGSARRRPLPAVLTGLALLALTACTDPSATISPTSTLTSSPTTAPTSTPTPTPTDPKDINIEAAKATYLEYIAVANTVEQAGMQGWQTEVMPYLGSAELMASMQSYYEQSAALGLREIGTTEVANITVTTYVEDPTGAGHERVEFDACMDNTTVDFVDPNGTSVLLAGFPKRLISTIVMQRQSSGVWKVAADETDQSRPC